MKILSIILLLLCMAAAGYAQEYNVQHTYLDAMELSAIYRKYLVDKNADDLYNMNNITQYRKFYTILEKYGITINNIDKNNFINAYKIIYAEPSGATADGSGEGEDAIDNTSKFQPSSVPSLNWQASIIGGLSSFMAGRFKQEVMHMGINALFKEIKDKGTSEIIRYIFPKTFAQVELLYGNGQNSYYTADLIYLKQVILSDYEDLPVNLVNNAAFIFPKLATDSASLDMLKAGYAIYTSGQQGIGLADIITNLSQVSYSNNSKVKELFAVADLLSNALMDSAGSTTPWINTTNLTRTTDHAIDKLEYAFLYGLLYEQLKTVPPIKVLLQPYESDTKKLTGEMNELFVFINSLNNTYSYIKTKDFNLTSADDEIFYLKKIQQAVLLFGSNSLIQQSFDIADSSLQISGKYLGMVEIVLQKNYSRAIPFITIELGNLMSARYYRTLAFVSQLAAINTADDMGNLLSAYSLPIGSASIKRSSKSNWTLNGYVGLTAGVERAYGQLANQDKANVGLTAPIGISYTFRPSVKNTVTLFASIIDIGSMVNARLGNDTTAYANLRFEHFLSPALGVFYNCRNSPISLGLNFNYIPNLRTIQYQNNNAVITETNTNVTRLNFCLLVDIPFLTLYNDPQKRGY